MKASYVRASMYATSGEADSLYTCLCWKETGNIGVAMTVTAGEEFGIRYQIRGDNGLGGMGPIRIEASFRFTGVPPSATLTSCHGVNEGAVPVKSGTWGNLKACYR